MATDSVSNDLRQAIPAELRPVVDHLVTEDDTPVDSVFSEKQQRLLTEPLYSSWAGPGQQRSFVAMSNVGLFFAVRHPPLVPDVLVEPGCRTARRSPFQASSVLFRLGIRQGPGRGHGSGFQP